MAKKSKRGGVRVGAGRPLEHGQAKRGRSVALSPVLWDYLASGESSVNNQIEETLRRTAGFKAFEKT